MTETVLIVDDEPSISDNIAFALNSEGLEAICVATALDAREQLAASHIDLIVLDIGLPDMNGFDFARDIRRTSNVPIIFVTARADEIDRIVGLEIGADDYVVKPFSPRELSARVKAVLRRSSDNQRIPPVQSHTTKTYASFAVDNERYRIDYHGETLALSRVEFRVLSMMIAAPGRVFSREQLMDSAWEHGGISLERTVDTHIKTLRKKLKAIADEDPIVTHRGIGYAIRDDL